MRGQANIVVSKFTKCKHDSPAAFKTGPQTMTKCFSEYQSAYKLWPWQPVRQILKPNRTGLTNDTVRAQMERKSIYGVDYGTVTFKKPKRRASPKRHKPKLSCPKDLLETKDTYELELIAKASCPANDESTATGSQQNATNAKENVGIPPTSKTEGNPKSTAQEDFIHHQNFEKPMPIRQMDNTERPTDPMQSNTEYSDFFTDKMKDVHHGKTPTGKPAEVKTTEQKQFLAISTAMADFTKPVGFVRQKPCHPPASNHFIPSPFDGRTTCSMAYRSWPVKRQEVPSWAKKPQYKRPVGGMLVNSLYMHDFRDPQMPMPPKPIHPNNNNTNLIEGNGHGDTKFENMSTYKKDFTGWQNTVPPQSYQIRETYKPPTEKMMCETNQRSHFRGEPSQKMKICRHPSQHRELNINQDMTFVTTYNETYVIPRPWSSPSNGSCNKSTDRSRMNSAPIHCPCPPPTPKSPEKPSQPIPKPNLEVSKKSDDPAPKKANPVPRSDQTMVTNKTTEKTGQ